MFFVIVGVLGLLTGVLLFAYRRDASDNFKELSERSPTVPSGMFTGAGMGCAGVVVIIVSIVFLIVGILNW